MSVNMPVVTENERLLTLIQSQQAQIEALQRRVIITRRQQDKLRAKGKAHVEKWAKLVRDLGQLNKDSVSDRVFKRRTILLLWSDYKRAFGRLNSYRDTTEADYERGIHWIDAWVYPGFEPLPPALPEATIACYLCEERPGKVEVEGGQHKICGTCAAIIEG